jgi:opacity protein-like surface antigen
MGNVIVKNHRYAGCIALLVCLLISSKSMQAQVIEAGFKGGGVVSWVRYDDTDFRKTVKVRPKPGYSFGPVLSFKVKDRYFLHTEYLFTTKGRTNIGKIDKVLKDKVTYYFLEVPVLYNVFFKGRLQFRGNKQFKYYAGAGPIFSYWLGARGSVFSSEHRENNLPVQKYKVVFGTRGEDFQKDSEVYIKSPSKMQLGFAIGGGILTEPTAKQRVMIDFRFEYGHSWIAKSEYEDFHFPVTYDPSVKARNMSLRLSAIFLLELNTNKKVRNKGKSNITRKIYK